MSFNVQFIKLSENAFEPYRGSKDAAGYDLKAAGDYTIAPGDTAKIPTDIAVALPKGTFGGIYARSGLATKHGIRPANCVGIIDSDYRGNIIVALHNDSNEIYEIPKGERIAQLIVQPYYEVNFILSDSLDETVRGASGFGDSGKF